MTSPINYSNRSNLQTFQLSNLLHHLTNVTADSLVERGNTIYYDINQNVSRYIVADYESLTKTLEEILDTYSHRYSHGELIVSLKKNDQNNTLDFKISHTSVIIRKEEQVSLPNLTYKDVYTNIYCSQLETGIIQCEFTIPYYEDENEKSYHESLKKILMHKKALFVGKEKNELKIIKYILETFGVEIEYITPEKFNLKKPRLCHYDLVLVRSSELTALQISFIKSMKPEKENMKIIVMHDIFVSREKREQAVSIADAEIFRPAIIGDVEEVLKNIYIENRVLNNLMSQQVIQKLKEFTTKGKTLYKKDDLRKFIGATVLLVDSSPLQLNMTKYILSSVIDNIMTAKNGNEALALLKNNKVDMIFTEINLSEVDGNTLAKKIRNELKDSKIPIIAISSFSFDQELHTMINHGITAHIPVPYSDRHFNEAMIKHMPKHFSNSISDMNEIERISASI